MLYKKENTTFDLFISFHLRRYICYQNEHVGTYVLCLYMIIKAPVSCANK